MLANLIQSYENFIDEARTFGSEVYETWCSASRFVNKVSHIERDLRRVKRKVNFTNQDPSVENRAQRKEVSAELSRDINALRKQLRKEKRKHETMEAKNAELKEQCASLYNALVKAVQELHKDDEEYLAQLLASLAGTFHEFPFPGSEDSVEQDTGSIENDLDDARSTSSDDSSSVEDDAGSTEDSRNASYVDNSESTSSDDFSPGPDTPDFKIADNSDDPDFGPEDEAFWSTILGSER